MMGIGGRRVLENLYSRLSSFPGEIIGIKNLKPGQWLSTLTSLLRLCFREEGDPSHDPSQHEFNNVNRPRNDSNLKRAIRIL